MRPKMDWWHSASERPRPQRRDSSSSDCEHPRLPRSYLASSGAPRLRIRNRLHHRRRRRHRLRSSAGRDSVFDLVEGGPFQHSLRDAETVLRQLRSWLAHYNQVHPHRALGYRSPREFIGSTHLDVLGGARAYFRRPSWMMSALPRSHFVGVILCLSGRVV